MKRKSLLGNAAIYTIGEVLPKALGIFMLPIFTQYLSPEDYGILAYTNSVTMFLFVVSVLSLNTFLIRHYYEIDKADEESKKKLIGNTFSFLMLYNLVLLALCQVLGPSLLAASGSSVAFHPYFTLALVTNLFNVASVVPLAVFRIQERPLSYVALGASRSIVQYLVAWVLITRLDWGILGIYYSALFTYAAYTILYFYAIYSHGKFNLNIKQIKIGLLFSIPLIPGVISNIIIDMIDRVMLEAHVAMAEIGLYSIAYNLGFGVSVVTMGGYKAFEPTLFREFRKEGFESTYRTIKTAFIFLVAAASTTLALFSKELITLLTTPRFHSAFLIVPVVVLAAQLRAQGLIFSIMLIADKKTRTATGIILTGAVINILLNLILIPWIGIWGAATSTVASYLVINFLSIRACDKKGIISARDLVIKDWVVLAILGSSIYFVVYVLDPPVGILVGLIKFALLCILGTVTALIFGLHKQVPGLLARLRGSR